jgi:hypothetical protein
VYLLRLVFLDGQHFAKFFMALAADVFVKGHRWVWLEVEGPVSFDEAIFLTELSQICGLKLFSRRLSGAELPTLLLPCGNGIPSAGGGFQSPPVPDATMPYF